MVLGGGDPYLIARDGGDPYSSVLDGGTHTLVYLMVGPISYGT